MLLCVVVVFFFFLVFFFQAEDGIRYLVRSRGLGDVYKRQALPVDERVTHRPVLHEAHEGVVDGRVTVRVVLTHDCLLYTSEAADERSSVDLGGRRIIKKKKRSEIGTLRQAMR